MRLLREIIRDTIHDLGIHQAVDQHRALVVWSSVVGDAISRVTTPQRISKGRLFIQVVSDSWRQELHYRKQELIEALNRTIGTEVVKEIILI